MGVRKHGSLIAQSGSATCDSGGVAGSNIVLEKSELYLPCLKLTIPKQKDYLPILEVTNSLKIIS